MSATGVQYAQRCVEDDGITPLIYQHHARVG